VLNRSSKLECTDHSSLARAFDLFKIKRFNPNVCHTTGARAGFDLRLEIVTEDQALLPDDTIPDGERLCVETLTTGKLSCLINAKISTKDILLPSR
jgi:hypothetical protein